MRHLPPCIAIVMLACLAGSGLAQPLPPDSAYVTVDDRGHLSLEGRRVRYWGMTGSFPNFADLKEGDTPAQRRAKIQRAYADADALIDRYEQLGFNLVRAYHGHPEPVAYTRGDGSEADIVDYFYAKLHERGMRVWCSAFNSTGLVRPDDVDVIDEPATAEGWREAVAGHTARYRYQPYEGAMALRKNMAIAWDERLEALLIQRMKNIVNHRNQYTGLRWADDPVFIVWEQQNEEWWIRRMLGGEYQNLPAFFRNSLFNRWHAFLKAKYGTQDRLSEAWGALLPGEALEAGTILLAPLAGEFEPGKLNDANPSIQNQGLKQTYGPDDFHPQRGADVLQFLTEMSLAHKQRVAAAVKPEGKSTRLSPMIFDTGIGYRIQTQYVLQHGDAIAHDSYINGGSKHPFDSRHPWDSGRDEQPRINQGVPWLEQNKYPGKPFFVYETQIQQPAKYRAEFPYRIAALGSIQDWDIICWHYFGPVSDITEADRPFDKPMDITTGGHPQGYHYTYDAVQNSAMRAASYMWRNQHLEPAPDPTYFYYGRRMLYDAASMPYGGSYGPKGLDMNGTTYGYGMRLVIDPTMEDNPRHPAFLDEQGQVDPGKVRQFQRNGLVIDGPVIALNDNSQPSPYTPTRQIAYHWRQGSLLLDAPGAVGYVGFLADWDRPVAFSNGVRLTDVAIHNPEGIAYPVTEDEMYIAFSLTSLTDQPLDRTDHAMISLVSTSFNTGFRLKGVDGASGTERGTTPVLEAKVAGTVHAPMLAGWSAIYRDWHHNEIGRAQLDAQGRLRIPNDQPIWYVELRQ